MQGRFNSLQRGSNLYGYSGPPNPKVLLVGESWGADEDKAKLPFAGVSGQELWRMLGQAFSDAHPFIRRLLICAMLGGALLGYLFAMSGFMQWVLG